MVPPIDDQNTDTPVGQPVSIVPYASHHRTACLNLFDSNVPTFFAAEERPDFAHFLDHLPGPFWVATLDDSPEIVGCGGVSIAADGHTAWLRWGMVAASWHRHGVGSHLLTARLRWIARQPGIEAVRVATTSNVAGFFLRHGFALLGTKTDWYGPGRARADLLLPLDDALRARLREPS